MNAKLLGVYGIWQREGEAGNLIAQHLVDLTHLLGRQAAPSRDFH
jgi:error-prone DNA polymerase